jgi:hypothetical protein
MDALDKLIEDKRAEIASQDSETARIMSERRSARERMVIELAALEKAASLRPSPAPPKNLRVGPLVRHPAHVRTIRFSKGGKPAGSINMDWRNTLQNLYPRTFHFGEFESIADGYGVVASQQSKRDRLRVFIGQGYVSGDDANGYQVTDEAARRFGFTKREEPPTGETEGASEPDTPSDASREGLFPTTPFNRTNEEGM